MATEEKKELIERTMQEFKKLDNGNKMFILGYMLGIQQEQQNVAHRQSQMA